jgi:hypothetical protein
LESNRL